MYGIETNRIGHFFSPAGKLLNKVHSLFTVVFYGKSKERVYSNKFGLEVCSSYSDVSPNHLIVLHHETS